MKLRIRGNSLRLRLLRGEVERFGATGRVSETIQFGNASAARLEYVLEIDAEAERIAADFDGNRITVKIPAPLARNWVEGDEITLKNEQPIDNDAGENNDSKNFLKILIEKDFVCLDRRDDPDNLDAFPHPTGKCG